MSCPMMSSHLEINVLESEKYIVFHKVTKKTYTLGEKEYEVLIRLDGITDLEKIAEKTGYSLAQANALVQVFERIGMLQSSDVKEKFNITRISHRVLNPNKIFRSKKLVRILSSILLYGTLPLLVIGILLNIWMGKDFMSIYTDILNSTRTPSVILTVPILLAVTFLHELGHSIVAKRYGVNVPELGVMLYWFMPTAYVNLAGVTLLKKKSQKLLAYSAGIIMNFMILAVVLIARPFIGQSFQFLVSWFVVDTLLGAIFNLFIFLKMDGYIILKEMVEIPDLRENAFQYITSSLARMSGNRLQGLTSDFQMQVYESNYTSMERALFICYGLLSAMYIPILLASIAISLFFTILS